jgi:DNA repair exonuclease SbcCD nuclease subunit
VLRQIADKKPDVVIHLGDIYYAGTQFEITNYFLKIWQQVLNLGDKLDRIPTYTLAGNHDMYSGGGPYYQLIQQLGQPASYFAFATLTGNSSPSTRATTTTTRRAAVPGRRTCRTPRSRGSPTK